MLGMDYALVYFFKNFAFSPPSWTDSIPFGELFFLGVSLYLFSMFMLYISKMILSNFDIPKFLILSIGIVCFANFVYLTKKLWDYTPNFSFWNIITFIMCFMVISTINFVFVIPLKSEN
jgi:hypothetical protein